jgi:hypothetical protein
MINKQHNSHVHNVSLGGKTRTFWRATCVMSPMRDELNWDLSWHVQCRRADILNTEVWQHNTSSRLRGLRRGVVTVLCEFSPSINRSASCTHQLVEGLKGKRPQRGAHRTVLLPVRLQVAQFSPQLVDCVLQLSVLVLDSSVVLQIRRQMFW